MGTTVNKKQRKTPPIGIDNFKELIEKCYFVDKSRFIAEILDNRGAQVTLLTRPRRFGKTLMLSMLEYFFTIEDAEDNKHLFQGLEIERMGSPYMDQQGKYPVIFISLKDCAASSFKDFLALISIEIAHLYNMFDFLEDSKNLNQTDKKNFSIIQSQTNDFILIQKSLMLLTEYLSKHYKKNPIILIDEYDAPVIKAWESNYYEDCIQFMRTILSSCLKTNRFLDFAVLSGVTRISKESIFSGLNNLTVCSCLSDQYSDIFGFTTDEVCSLMNYYDIPDKFDEVRKWYDGYIFGEKEIYNPWSIMQYVYNGYKPRTYWVNTSENSIFYKLLHVMDEGLRKDLEMLIKGDSIEKKVDETLVYGEIEESELALFSVLVYSGYLKVISKEFIENYWLCTLQIPNLEILNVYKFEIKRHISPRKTDVLKDLLNAMTSGDERAFQENLQIIILRNTSYFDHTKKNQESFFHGLVLGLMVYLEDSYQVISNRESGKGRFDILLLPKEKQRYAVLLELKVARSKKHMQEDAVQARKQIDLLAYDTLCLQNDIVNIWKYGISFFKKDICIVKDIEEVP